MCNTALSIVGVALCLGWSGASATAAFVCVADSPAGMVVFGDAADSSDHAPLDPAYGSPSLRVGSSTIALSQTELRRDGAWFVFRDRKTKMAVFSMRKLHGSPIIPLEPAHPFCDAKNWRESCWSAKLVIALDSRRINVERALCGVG